MLGKPIVDIAIILETLNVILIVLNRNSIVVLLHDVIMIRDVMVNGAVTSFWYVLLTGGVTLLVGAAIG